MRIQPGVSPTPIVSSPAPQKQSPDTAVATLPMPSGKVDHEPMTVEVGDKLIQLQPGELAKVLDKVNETARIFNRSLQFELGQGNQMVIRVVDTVSGQVLREIPPENFMDAFHRMEAALGLLLDMKA